MASLNKLRWLQRSLNVARVMFYRKIWGMDIHRTVRMSLDIKLDKTYPDGVHIGEFTYLAFGVAILSHDMTRAMYAHTRIGSFCFIGARSMIMPGVTIGDQCLIAAGSVVTKSVPANSLVAGNPAQVIRSDIVLERYGRFSDRSKWKP